MESIWKPPRNRLERVQRTQAAASGALTSVGRTSRRRLQAALTCCACSHSLRPARARRATFGGSRARLKVGAEPSWLARAFGRNIETRPANEGSAAAPRPAPAAAPVGTSARRRPQHNATWRSIGSAGGLLPPPPPPVQSPTSANYDLRKQVVGVTAHTWRPPVSDAESL